MICSSVIIVDVQHSYMCFGSSVCLQRNVSVDLLLIFSIDSFFFFSNIEVNELFVYFGD